MDTGWVYCFSNPCIPGLLKVGMTRRTPEERLKDATASTWTPRPFYIEFAKHVTNPAAKERALHALLARYAARENSRREFFRVSVSDVRCMFELMDGEWWSSTSRSIVTSRYFQKDKVEPTIPCLEQFAYRRSCAT